MLGPLQVEPFWQDVVGLPVRAQGFGVAELRKDIHRDQLHPDAEPADLAVGQVPVERADAVGVVVVPGQCGVAEAVLVAVHRVGVVRVRDEHEGLVVTTVHTGWIALFHQPDAVPEVGVDADGLALGQLGKLSDVHQLLLFAAEPAAIE